MTDFLKKILIEANLDKDYENYQKALKFVEKAKELISQFPNKFVSYNPKEDFAQVQISKMTIQLFGKNNAVAQRMLNQSPPTNAGYAPKDNILNLYGIDISYDKKSKKLNVEFPSGENEIVHELTHFLDLQRSGEKSTKEYFKKIMPQELEKKFTPEYLAYAKKVGRDPNDPQVYTFYQTATGQSVQKTRDFDEYANDPYEMNAHFMEHIMPQINNYISKTSQLPTDFETFKNNLFKIALNDKNFKFYYNNLTEKNKKKFLKRIGVYYDQLKNFVAKDQNIDFNPNTTSLAIHKPTLNKFFDTIKNIFSKQKAA